MEGTPSKTLRVTVCAGTTCALMDGGNLLDLESQLPEALQGRVEVRGARCLEQCHKDRPGEAPYVLVEGELMGSATVQAVIHRLQALLAEQE